MDMTHLKWGSVAAELETYQNQKAVYRRLSRCIIELGRKGSSEIRLREAEAFAQQIFGELQRVWCPK